MRFKAKSNQFLSFGIEGMVAMYIRLRRMAVVMGKIMGKSWKNQGKSWENHGKPL